MGHHPSWDEAPSGSASSLSVSSLPAPSGPAAVSGHAAVLKSVTAATHPSSPASVGAASIVPDADETKGGQLLSLAAFG